MRNRCERYHTGTARGRRPIWLAGTEKAWASTWVSPISTRAGTSSSAIGHVAMPYDCRTAAASATNATATHNCLPRTRGTVSLICTVVISWIRLAHANETPGGIGAKRTSAAAKAYESSVRQTFVRHHTETKAVFTQITLALLVPKLLKSGWC